MENRVLPARVYDRELGFRVTGLSVGVHIFIS